MEPAPETRPAVEVLHGFGAVMIAFVVVGGALVLTGLSFSFTPLFWSALALGAAFLALTQIAPPRVGRPLARGFELIGLGIFGAVVYFFLHAPGIFAYMLSKKITEALPYGLQMATMLVWIAALAVGALLMYSRTLRAQAKAAWDAWAPGPLQIDPPGGKIPAWGAVALYVNFVFIAMGGFAAFAFILYDPAQPAPLFLPGSNKEVSHGALADFFAWHLLDAIPGLKVPETIKWTEPLTYERAGAGWLLLAFKIIVIVPAIRGIGCYLKDDEDEEAKEPSSPERRGGVGPTP